MSQDYQATARSRSRPSLVRFADSQDRSERLTRRYSGNESPDHMDPFAVATGVNNPVSRTSSVRSATLAVPSVRRQPSEMDIVALYSAYEDMSPSSVVSYNTKRTSDATLNDATPRASINRGGFGTKKRSSSFDSASERRAPSGSALPSLDYDTVRNMPRNRTWQENGEHGDDGFLAPVKHAFSRLAYDPHEPSALESRASSSSISSYFDNFERSQAINDEVEDTYLIDEGLRRRRHPQERASMTRQQSDMSQKGGPLDGYKSYRDRRKKDKHTIKYHAEPPEDYQKFILVFAKALLAFGSPSHRIEAQLNSLSKVFELEAQFQHTPGNIQVSFGNPEQRSSETCLIKSNVSLSLGRIHSVHNVYRSVLHDDMFASDGMHQLRRLLYAPPQYGQTFRYVLSFIICFLICGVAFGGSLNDMWVAGVMGVLVRFMQNIASKSDLSASGSEVFTAAIVSFVARGFASYHSQIWCSPAISSAAIVSLLPGYLILSGSLDIAGKNQSLGAPKIVSGIMTSLYLGFGLTLGSDLFLFVDRPARRAAHRAAARLVGNTVIQGSYQAFNSTDSGFGNTGNATFTGYFTFVNSSAPAPPELVQNCFRDKHWRWYLQPVPFWSLFFLVPLFAFCSSMNNQQHWFSRQMIVMVTIACISFWITRLCNITLGLSNHPDYVSLVGSFLVGTLGNGYSRRFGGTAFTAMLTGILLLVPDGLSAAGGLAQQNQGTGQDEYTQSLTLARKMISVIIGILAGVYFSAAIIYLFGKKKNAALVTF